MASDLSDLYQEILLEHNRRPRNFRALDDATHQADGFNPLCGDQISLQLRVGDDKVDDVGFQGHGCAISRASASMLTQAVKGSPRRTRRWRCSTNSIGCSPNPTPS